MTFVNDDRPLVAPTWGLRRANGPGWNARTRVVTDMVWRRRSIAAKLSLMELLKEGRWRLLGLCWLGWVSAFYSLILYAFLMPSVGRELLLTDHEQAWVNGASLLATAGGGLGLGRLADAIGRRPVFVLSIFVFSAGNAIAAAAGGFGSILIARCVTGIGVGGEWGVGHALAAENVPPEMRGRASGVLQAGSPVAMATAALVGSLLAPRIGWRACLLLSSAPVVIAVAGAFLLPSPPPSREPSRSFTELFRGELLRPSLAMLLLLTLNMAAFWCTYTNLPTYLHRDLGKSPQFVAGFQLLVSTGHLAGNLSFGALADRFPRTRVFSAYASLFAFGILCIALAFPFLSERLPLLVLSMAAIGIGAGSWSCFGALFADHFPPSHRGTAASGFYSASRGVQLATQIAVVGLASALSMPTGRAGLFLGALSSALAAATVWLLPSHRRADAAPELARET